MRLAGIKLLSRKEVASLGELASDCLNNEELNRYSRGLTQLYLKKGYIAARVAAEGPDEQGVLILRVHEGRVEKIVSDDRRSNPATLFPGVIGRPLNIHDADQGLTRPTACRPARRHWTSCPAKPWAAPSSACATIRTRPGA